MQRVLQRDPARDFDIADAQQASAVGGPEKVRADIARFIERTAADEIIVSGATFDPAKRRRSLEITARAIA